MASIGKITGDNIESFGGLIPELLKQGFLSGEDLRFYGIEEGGAAAGVVVVRDSVETAELKYLYILPEYRGTGLMDEMLTVLFLLLRNEGFRYIQMFYIPEIYPTLRYMSKRFGFTEKPMDFAYFRFTPGDIQKSKAAAINPQGILRLKYLPEDKKKYLFGFIRKNLNFHNMAFDRTNEVLPYSMVYMTGDTPKGALVIEHKSVENAAASEEYSTYPEPGAYDFTLFFAGAVDQKAPISLLSGLCKLSQKELPENTRFTGYFPEGPITRLIEGALGIRGQHEVAATLNLESF